MTSGPNASTCCSIRSEGENWRPLRNFTPPGPSDPTIPTVDAAAQIVSTWQSVFVNPASILRDPEEWRKAYRTAAGKLHPDRGGDQNQWHLLQAAKTLLDAHHGI